MAHELYEKMTQLQWLLHKQQIRGWAAYGPLADTTRGQGRILAILKLRDGISTKDLSYLLGVRISSLNEQLAKLEKGDYVTREPSEQDKRVMLVKLTEKGRNEQQAEPYDFDDIFSCLTDEEQRVFGEYLNRIIAALHTNTDNNDDMFEKMEALRNRFGDIGAFFKENGFGFPIGMGMHYGPRRGHNHDRFDRDGFPDSNGFHGHNHDHNSSKEKL